MSNDQQRHDIYSIRKYMHTHERSNSHTRTIWLILRIRKIEQHFDDFDEFDSGGKMNVK